jgi:hypothetical protein
MQQAIRWRRRRPATWQVVLARWFLAIAVVVTLSPSAIASDGVVRAQDRGPDAPGVGQTTADDDTHPEHATAGRAGPGGAVPCRVTGRARGRPRRQQPVRRRRR